MNRPMAKRATNVASRALLANCLTIVCHQKDRSQHKTAEKEIYTDVQNEIKF